MPDAKKRLIEAAALLFVAAAGNTPATSRPADEAELQRAAEAYNATVNLESQKLVCKHEARIGTRIKRPVCRTRGILDSERRNAKRYMNKPRPTVTRDDALSF